MAVTQIRGAQVLDATITAADLASDSVTTVKILDANVTLAKFSIAAQPGSEVQISSMTLSGYVTTSTAASFLALK